MTDEVKLFVAFRYGYDVRLRCEAHFLQLPSSGEGAGADELRAANMKYMQLHL